MRKFIISAVFTILNIMLNTHNSLAIDLQAALVSVYNNSDDLAITRRDFLDAIEAYPRALSQFMPRVSAQAVFATDGRKSKYRSTGNTISSVETQDADRALVLEQPIFNGGGSVARLKSAQATFREARGTYYANEQEILLKAIEIYLSYYEFKEKNDIFKISVKAIEKQLEAEQEKFNVGESTKTELARARAALAHARTEQLANYANLQTARAQFVKTFGIEPQDITLPVVPNDLPNSLEELKLQSLKANQTLEVAKHRTSVFKANEMVTKAGLLPQVNFRIYGLKRYREQGLKNSSNSEKTNQINIESRLTVDIPIIPEGGAVYSNIRRAKLATRTNLIKQEATMKGVIAECMSSWAAFNAAKSRVAASTQGIAAAQQAYEGMVQEELVGTKTLLDVLNMEEKLNNARISKVEAHKQCIVTAYKMKMLLGQLTAKSLKLQVNYFIPEHEFKKVKMKVIGF